MFELVDPAAQTVHIEYPLHRGQGGVEGGDVGLTVGIHRRPRYRRPEARTVDEVVVVGRRGPLQTAFTTLELRELGELENVDVVVDPAQLAGITDEDAAVAAANATPYGLSASVWTENARRAASLPRRLDFGTVWVNDHLAFAIEMPWGGFKASGYGRDLSAYSLDDFSRTKHVMVKHRA